MNPVQKGIMGDINTMRGMGYQTGGAQPMKKKRPVQSFPMSAINRAWGMLQGKRG